VDDVGTRTAAYTYDEVGNTRTRPTEKSGTQTLTWDPEGHLATSTDSAGTTSYIYDADGNRLIRRDPTGSTLYLPGQEVRYTKGTGAKNGTRYYGHAGETIATRTAAGLVWLSGDHHGTAQISITADRQDVSIRRETPFGAVRATTGTWPSTMDKGFVGGTNDNTGLTHLGAREYDPTIGRFISVDPVLDLSSPIQMNAYNYANNAPASLSDPSGLDPCSVGGQGCDFKGSNGIYYPSPEAAQSAQPQPQRQAPARNSGGGSSGQGKKQGCGWNPICHTQKWADDFGDWVECKTNLTCNRATSRNPDMNGDGKVTIGDLAGGEWAKKCEAMGDPKGVAICKGATPGVVEITDIAADITLGAGDIQGCMEDKSLKSCAMAGAFLVGGVEGGGAAKAIGKAAKVADVAVDGAKLTPKISMIGSVSFTAKQLQAKFKHASDFGVTGNYNPANAAKFEEALRASMGDPNSILILGRYRKKPEIFQFHYNVLTQNVVVADSAGNFVSGWKLGPAQSTNLLGRGTLGGG
jgi:RHS repeat-associated protein